MSKLDIGVGDEFPLDESADHRHKGGHRGRHGNHHHHMHHGHHHNHHHRPHVLGRIAILLLIAGLAALIVEHRLPVEAAYGMIGLGTLGIVTMAALHWRRHHRPQQQVS
ncbi:MAG: hypothetical protein ABI608_07630 [Rhizomicrobium sp.]